MEGHTQDTVGKESSHSNNSKLIFIADLLCIISFDPQGVGTVIGSILQMGRLVHRSQCHLSKATS